jgi:putative ABC transport system substrate-binding protein
VRRRDFVLLLTSVAWPFIVQADVFRAGSTLPLDRRAVFTEALMNFGWIEGKNIAFEDRSGENQIERLSEVASELVRLKVDAIVAIGTLAAFAARRATSTIAIIMAPASDPADTGLVASLARPGGNSLSAGLPGGTANSQQARTAAACLAADCLRSSGNYADCCHQRWHGVAP